MSKYDEMTLESIRFDNVHIVAEYIFKKDAKLAEALMNELEAQHFFSSKEAKEMADYFERKE